MLVRLVSTFALGVYVGQEHQKTVPNIKEEAKKYYHLVVSVPAIKGIIDDLSGSKKK